MDEATVAKKILAFAHQEITSLISEVGKQRPNWDLDRLEAASQEAARRIGRLLLETLVCVPEDKIEASIPGHSDVGDGKHRLPFIELRERTLLTTLGPIRYERAYYHSKYPKDTRFPRDEELDVAPKVRRSARLRELESYLSVVAGSYDQGVEVLWKLLGVRLEYKQAQRDCIKLGETLEAAEAKELEEAFDHRKPLTGAIRRENAPECLVVSVDGVTVKHCAGGSMEIKVGRVFRAGLRDPVAKRRRKRRKRRRRSPRRGGKSNKKRQQELEGLKASQEQLDYSSASDLVTKALKKAAPKRAKRPMYRQATEKSTYRATTRLGTDTLGKSLWLAAERLGLSISPLTLFLADGSKWCWNLCETHFAEATQILDVFHLARHVVVTANALYREGSAEAKAWRHEMMVRLLRGQAPAILDELSRLTFTSPKKRKAKEDLRRYITNNINRMDYPSYIANGYPISSALIEGACRHVIGQRMKGCGRRWDEKGAEAMVRMRAIFCSGKWDAVMRRRKEARSV